MSYLTVLSNMLGLHVTKAVHLKLATSMPAQEQRNTVNAVHQRLQKVIGSPMFASRETLAACIQDDLIADRITDVHGLRFSHTELALLLASRTVVG